MSGLLTRSYRIGTGEVDSFGMLRASSLLYFLQEAATAHSEELNFSREDLLRSDGAVWILAKIAFYLHKPLKYLYDLEIDTWHRGPSGACFYRDFDIRCGGRDAGRALSAWVVASRETGKTLRPASLPELPAAPGDRLKYTDTLGRLYEPEDCAKAGVRMVRYSDLDVNGHLNNTRYADIACDALGLQERTPCYVSHMQINYNAECRAGDELLLYTGSASGSDFYVTGKDAAGKRRFESRLHIESL